MIIRLYLFTMLLMLQGIVGARAATTSDITLIPLEQLLVTEFIPASHIARQISDAPSAVSIVTAQDIHDYGYRSLAEILKSMRGLYVTSSLDYDYLGGRGFGTPGDYAGRIMLMIDGYVTNDNYYNQIFLGEDAFLDVAMIKRVEFIPGPGSTTYGNGAFLGVINIVTKNGQDFDGAQLAASFGSNGERRKRLTFGKKFDNGAEILLSASKYGDDGISSKFPSLDEPYNDLDIGPIKQAKNQRLFVKGNYQGWTLEFASIKKLTFDTAFLNYRDPADITSQNKSLDENSFISLKYDTEFNAHLTSSNHLYYGQYLYRQDGNSVDPQYSYIESSVGRWWGADFKFVGTWFDDHKLLFGTEYRNDYKQSYSYSEPYSDFNSNADDNMRTVSLYVQDEYAVTDTLTLTPGLRYDNNTLYGSSLSPRIAAIYSPWSSSTFKLSYGKAFRYPNPFETFFFSRDPESVTTTELVWQQQFTSKTRLTASLYSSHIDKALSWTYNELDTTGQELGLEYVNDYGFRLNASITHQDTKDNYGQWLINSPRWLSKLNLVQPLFQHRAIAGFEVQTIGRRLDGDNNIVQSSTVANLTLSSNRILPDTNISLSIKNLFRASQEDVLNIGNLPVLQSNDRTILLQLEYNIR